MGVTEKRRRFVEALNHMDGLWVKYLEDSAFYDINYSDLFTGLWRADKPVRKRDAVSYIRHVGPQTAAKYIDKAIKSGYIKEVPDPSDGRAKLLALSLDMQQRLEQFFDASIKEFRKALL